MLAGCFALLVGLIVACCNCCGSGDFWFGLVDCGWFVSGLVCFTLLGVVVLGLLLVVVCLLCVRVMFLFVLVVIFGFASVLGAVVVYCDAVGFVCCDLFDDYFCFVVVCCGFLLFGLLSLICS